MRRLVLTAVFAAFGLEAHAHEQADDAAYVSVSARIENAAALRTGLPSLNRESAIVVCLGQPERAGDDGHGCAAVWWDTRSGAVTSKTQHDRVLLREAPVRDASGSLSIVSIRVWRNDVVSALAKAAGLASRVPALQASAGAVDLRDVSTQLAGLAEGRKKRVLTLPQPAASAEATEVVFAIDPKNREVPRRLATAPDCKRTPAADGCDAPRVVVRFQWTEFVGDASRWVDPIVESCALPKGQTTVSMKEAIEAAAGRLSDAQLRAERRLFARAEAVLAARAASLQARNPDRAAEKLWAYFADASAGASGPLWAAHYRERAAGLEQCIADLELYGPVQGLASVLARDPQHQGEPELHALATYMAQMQAAQATFNDVFHDANLRRGQLEIEPMQTLERSIKNADETAVAGLVATSSCERCQTLGRQWLDGRSKDRASKKDGEVRTTLLQTDRALQDMEDALDARQVQLAGACRAYDAGRTGRLLADVKDAKTGVEKLIVHTTFDDDSREALASLRADLLQQLPEVISTLARPIESACAKKGAGTPGS